MVVAVYNIQPLGGEGWRETPLAKHIPLSAEFLKVLKES